MRAIFINSETRTVTEGEIDATATLRGMQKAVGGLIERGASFANGDELYVNEEGLLNAPQFFFDIGAHQPFAGNAIIVNANRRSGATTAAKSSVEEIRQRVVFLTLEEVRAKLN